MIEKDCNVIPRSNNQAIRTYEILHLPFYDLVRLDGNHTKNRSHESLMPCHVTRFLQDLLSYIKGGCEGVGQWRMGVARVKYSHNLHHQ